MPYLPVEFELLIPLAIALFFSFLFESDPREYLWSGLVAMITWLITGMVFLITSTYPTIALIFLAIAILYIVRIVILTFEPLRQKRKLDDET